MALRRCCRSSGWPGADGDVGAAAAKVAFAPTLDTVRQQGQFGDSHRIAVGIVERVEMGTTGLPAFVKILTSTSV
jgi:hypothetical protein